MCGIHLLLYQISGKDFIKKENLCSSRIHNRGPDAHHTISRAFPHGIQAIFSGFTLHFQGQLTPQPLCCPDKSNNLLLWNGEIFSGIETGNTNDGAVILNHLTECQTDSEILAVLLQVRGPWAFIFWQESQKKLWFGRDVFGRRSLLYHYSSQDTPSFMLSSVATENIPSWKEVPANGVYAIDFTTEGKPLVSEITHYPWIVDTRGDRDVQEITESTELFHHRLENVTDVWGDIAVVQNQLGINVPFGKFNDTISEGVWSDLKCDNGDFVSFQEIATHQQLVLSDGLTEVLGQAVRVRVERQSHLCHKCITTALKYQQSSCTDSKSSGSIRGAPSLVVKDTSSSGNAEISSNVGRNREVSSWSDGPPPDGTTLGVMSSGTKEPPTLCRGDRCGHTRVGILYSGGIDSLVLAALADKFVPLGEPIDLLNVAFEQKSEGNKSKQHAARSQSERVEVHHFEVPDRITGRDGIEQLSKTRTWNFVEINITLEELQEVRAEHVKKLVYPLNTVLDDSIGCAVWFAARGQGVINNGDRAIPYTTTARVLLVGMGADEQFVGYSRHRVKYKTGGLAGLVDEIQMEIARISARNLGRDDRVISDHSKESRFPFLDEEVVSFLNKIPITQKVNLELPRGIGDKFLLRLAAEKLGLTKSCTLAKRAIQFGSRIAKCENKKEKGSDVCDRL